jgi:CheY-like chemotaxis protein
LGLAISKRLANLLAGELVVRSALHKGSTFTLTIETGPVAGVRMVACPATALLKTSPEASPQPAPARQLACRLLLAEDGPDNQRLVAFLLRRAGAEVSVVENGRLAVEYVQAAQGEGRPFDLVLMDMQMPVMDGYEATKRLRAQGYAAPIVALTAHAMAGDREKCLSAGCDDYVSKPISISSLMDAVARHAKKPTDILDNPRPAGYR